MRNHSLCGAGPALLATALILAGATVAAPARAGTGFIQLPTITAAPGATVQFPIDLSNDPTPFNVYSIDFRMNFTPGVLSGSALVHDGFLDEWGAPFVNANASFLAAATAGTTPLTTSTTRLASIELTISPGATPGTDMPLTFFRLRFNEGSPFYGWGDGVLRVRTSADAPFGGAAMLALERPVPSPAATSTRLAFTLGEEGGDARLVVHALDGRRVRVLAHGPAPAGRHEVRWDLRDGEGRRVAPGVYFARLERGGRAVARRVLVLP